MCCGIPPRSRDSSERPFFPTNRVRRPDEPCSAGVGLTENLDASKHHLPEGSKGPAARNSSCFPSLKSSLFCRSFSSPLANMHLRHLVFLLFSAALPLRGEENPSLSPGGGDQAGAGERVKQVLAAKNEPIPFYQRDFRLKKAERDGFCSATLPSKLELLGLGMNTRQTLRHYVSLKSDGGSAITLTGADQVEDQVQRGVLEGDCEKMWDIFAASWEEASAIHAMRLGWRPYHPMGEPRLCPRGCGSHYYPLGSGQCPLCGLIEPAPIQTAEQDVDPDP